MRQTASIACRVSWWPSRLGMRRIRASPPRGDKRRAAVVAAAGMG
jgi:hypothetical protein